MCPRQGVGIGDESLVQKEKGELGFGISRVDAALVSLPPVNKWFDSQFSFDTEIKPVKVVGEAGVRVEPF
jgi:hypothetical protein